VVLMMWVFALVRRSTVGRPATASLTHHAFAFLPLSDLLVVVSFPTRRSSDLIASIGGIGNTETVAEACQDRFRFSIYQACCAEDSIRAVVAISGSSTIGLHANAFLNHDPCAIFALSDVVVAVG